MTVREQVTKNCHYISQSLSHGILPRSKVLAAVGWIFHTGAPVVFERLVGAPHLTDEARVLVRDALVDEGDGFSRLR